jgi:hypothetical protein
MTVTRGLPSYSVYTRNADISIDGLLVCQSTNSRILFTLPHWHALADVHPPRHALLFERYSYSFVRWLINPLLAVCMCNWSMCMCQCPTNSLAKSLALWRGPEWVLQCLLRSRVISEGVAKLMNRCQVSLGNAQNRGCVPISPLDGWGVYLVRVLLAQTIGFCNWRIPLLNVRTVYTLLLHKNVHTGSRIHANVHSMYIPRTCLQAHTDPCTDRVQISYEESYI